ncbi:MAG: 6-hydroxymethylpterin diphosphokinase MptE-like protein [Glaciecola sp.]
MLNDIRLHVAADDALQSQYEQKFAREIKHRELNNIAAFKRYMPNVAAIIDQLPVGGWSIFVNKFEQSNLVHVNSGNTYYSVHVDEIIDKQCEFWAYHSALVDTRQNTNVPMLPSCAGHDAVNDYAKALQTECDTQLPQALVILGIGKGKHLQYLLEQICTKHIAIYEPDWEVFKLSLMLFDWATFLQQATEQKTQLYLQLGPQPASVYDDMQELQTQLGVNRVLFYQHTKSPLNTHIINSVRQHKWGPQIFENVPVCRDYRQHYLNHICAVTPSAWQSNPQSLSMFTANMSLFKAHFSDIYDTFKDYIPRDWQVLHKQNGEVNLFNRNEHSFYSDDTPKHNGQLLAQGFSEHPNLDGLAFGYTGDKLKHYVHNTFVRQADMCLQSVDNEKRSLPPTVKALLVFGLGSGYVLESLYNSHNIKNLIICEPNPDFFYASLYAFDWQPIFSKIQDTDARLYINIGEASSRLNKDLMSQFLAIGPHLLNETYILQSYKNPLLQKVLNEVRIQLQVIFSMGENFDHVLYGLGHTHYSLQHKHPMLRHTPSQYLTHKQKQLPIFIVGNGPSLDDNINLLKECAEQVIIVSCGTALQALHRNNIVPDFHAEVEQNRANFDWISRIGDYQYLKKITLIGVTGMHPDSIALFKRVMLSFKSGESSTVSTLAMMPERTFETLDFAYPTVSNLVVNLFVTLGFEQLYLVGVDLGFADKNKHHSQSSGYYVNNQQIYDYQAAHNTELTAKGNKQDWVFTKTEFNISRMIIEQALQEGRAECFNLSNGVFIEGTLPLESDNVLIVTSSEHKLEVLQAIDDCYMSLSSNVTQLFSNAYNNDLFRSQVNALIALCNKRMEKQSDIDLFIHDLREQLFDARRCGGSLYFYYFFNSVNYLCAVLSKANMQSDSQEATQIANIILDKWQLFLGDASHLVEHQFQVIDTASAFASIREALLLKEGHTASMPLYIPNNTTLSSQSLRAIQSDDAFTVHNVVTTLPTSGKFSAIITSAQEFKSLIKCLKNATSIALCVFHDYALLLKCQHFDKANQTCLMFIAPPIANKQERTALQIAGSEPYTLLDNYLHTLRTRALDTSLFKIVLCKPQFDKAGLINACEFKTHNSLVVEDNIKAQNLVSNGNEYESLAVNSLNKHFVKHMNNSTHYMFKHYIGFEHRTSSDINVLDTLNNRGLYINRSPRDFELLGAWHD